MNRQEVEQAFKVIWISGMPRSGTTWLSQIFASSPHIRLKFCPLFSYEFKNKLGEQSTEQDWRSLFNEVYKTRSEYLDQEYLRKNGLIPSFDIKLQNPQFLAIKSTRFHNLVPYLLNFDLDIKFVHIVRDPMASLYSWLSSPYEFPANAKIEDEWRTGACRKNGPGEFWGFEDWKTVNQKALNYSLEYKEKFRIIQYEQLVKTPESLCLELFEFLDIPFEEQTKCFLDRSTNTHDENRRSVFKKVQPEKKWLQNLDPEIVKQCKAELIGTSLEQFIVE